MTDTHSIVAATHAAADRLQAEGHTQADARELAASILWAATVAADPQAARQILARYQAEGGA